MGKIINQIFDEERALYGKSNLELINVSFQGPKDGESALKETRNIKLENCLMDLRYPLWHSNKVEVNNSKMTENCRAGIWYAADIKINDTVCKGIKVIRECKRVEINNSKIVSMEFAWKSEKISLNSSSLASEYAFLDSKDIILTNVNFSGKYSFQYVKNLRIEDSLLDTKDAFWHADGVTVINSTVKGEYLGWYSKNLTFINCKIIGTQPLCYAKNLKLIDCEMIDTDLAFEYSDVSATIKGNIVSVKNPIKGFIKADTIGDIILENSKYPLECKIELNK